MTRALNFNWVGDGPLPVYFTRYFSGVWRRRLPGYAQKVWRWPEGVAGDGYGEGVSRAVAHLLAKPDGYRNRFGYGKLSLASDLYKYYLFSLRGGIWLDMDTFPVCTQEVFDELQGMRLFRVIRANYKGRPDNFFFGGSPPPCLRGKVEANCAMTLGDADYVDWTSALSGGNPTGIPMVCENGRWNRGAEFVGFNWSRGNRYIRHGFKGVGSCM